MFYRQLKKRLSFLVYHENETPKYYSVNPWRTKIYLFILPSITLLAILSILGVGVYFKQIREYARKKEPEIFQKLRDKNDELTSRVSELTTLTSTLEGKLSQSSGSADESGVHALGLFQIPPGLQDKSSRPDFSIREQKLKIQNGRVKFTFNIHNEGKEDQKLAGYFFVLLKNATGYQLYPTPKSLDNFQISYNHGEYFATTRFRPVVADFKQSGDDLKYLFKIIIFSRTGDLMYKLTQPMVVEE